MRASLSSLSLSLSLSLSTISHTIPAFFLSAWSSSRSEGANLCSCCACCSGSWLCGGWHCRVHHGCQPKVLLHGNEHKTTSKEFLQYLVQGWQSLLCLYLLLTVGGASYYGNDYRDRPRRMAAASGSWSSATCLPSRTHPHWPRL